MSCRLILQSCGQLSEGSGRATNFYELDAQVRGMTSLEQSLVRLLPFIPCARDSMGLLHNGM